MTDTRGRDSPPIFYLATQMAWHKYHALLMQPVWVGIGPLTDLHISLQNTRDVAGDYGVQRPRGIYGFDTVEARDKFCRRCNAAADLEDKVCIPVTVPNIFADVPLTTTIRFNPAPDTGPVTKETAK